MLVKNYPGQASMTGGAMVETELSDLAGLFAQWDGSDVILATQVMAEPGGNGAGKKTRKKWQPESQESEKKECVECGKLKWVNEQGLCKWCAKRLSKVAGETTISSTGDAAGDAGDENAAPVPACVRCGKTGVPLGKKSGMCANCNLVTAQDEGKLAKADRRAGGGMQVLAQGMRRGSGMALKGRKLG